MSAHAAGAPCANALMRRRFRRAHELLDAAIEGHLAVATHRHPPLVRVAQDTEQDLPHLVRVAQDLEEDLPRLVRVARDTEQELPTGTIASVGTCYARAVLCEDLSVNGVLAAGTPLALSTWAGRTGLSELPLFAGPTDWRSWARRVRLDLAELRPYARAVYAATDDYLAALPDEAIDPARGELPMCVLNALLLTLAMRRGEIAYPRCP